MELVSGGGNSSGQIWIENHPDLGWCPGRVDGLGPNGKFIVTDEQGTNFEIPQDKARQVDGNCLKGVDDLLDLGDFNEGALLHNIRVRYFKDEIYTGIGNPILISLNPYQQFASLYGAAKMKYYKDRGNSILSGDAKFAPHLFSVGAASFNAMIGDSKNQSIIISGESGAGKTEATKRILTYFANLQSDQSKGPAAAGGANIEEQVLRSNPILEAFGNAKTIRNDNSSRFGKYIDIKFDMDGKLRSAKISNYLLEKCRIVTQQPDERGYHAFYQLCAGARTMSLNSLLALRDASQHNYCCGCTRINNVDDEEDYNEMVECMASLGFTVEEKHDVFKIVAAVLHLGDMDFEEHPEKGHGTRITTPGAAERISEILGVQTPDFIKVFQYKTLEDPLTRAIINTEQDIQSSSNTRHSMAKVAYSRLFDWLVWRINQATSAKTGSKDTRNIGILDIYGFEVFEWNSFEQLCINFANEKLQQHFNSHMFTLEQQLYTDEGITWSHIQWQDNREIIDSLDRKHVGLFQIVDSECLMPNATDVTCLSKVRSSFKNSKIVYQPTRFASTNFGVAHYAGEVIYDIVSFLEKNTDKLHADIINLLKASSSSLVKKIFTDPLFAPEQAQAAAAPARGAGGIARRTTAAMGRGAADTGRAKQNVTVSMMFRQQLDQLVDDLNKTHPRYIRCIKPNAHKMAHEFDSLDVQRQLRCAGMLESIRIRRAGYSVRRPFKEFYNRFRVLCPNIIVSKARGDPDYKELSRQILQQMEQKLRADKVALEDKMWQIGRSKVFLKEDLQGHLEGRIAAAVSRFVIRVQKWYQGFRARKRYKALKAAALLVQAQLRTFTAKTAYRESQMRFHATVALQATLRMAGPRRLWLRRASAVRKMQALARGFLTRRKIGRLKGKKAEERIAKMREEEERAKALEAAKQAAEEQRKAMEEMQRQMAAEREKAQEEARRQLEEERAKLKQEEAAREAKLAEQARAAEEANKLENVRQDLLESRKEVARLQAQLDNAPVVSPASAAAEEELEHIRKEVQELRRDKVKLEVELATAKSSEEYDSLVAEMNTLREECSALRRANFDTELQLEQNSAQLNAWQKQAQRAEESIRELSSLRAAHDEMQVEMHKLQAQKAAMEDRVQNDEALRAELKDLRLEKRRLAGDMETSKMREEAMAEKLKAAEKLSLELQQQRQRTMTMEAELDASRKQVDRFRTQVTELSNNASASRAESLESMRTELLSKFEPKPRSSLGGPGALLPPADDMAGEAGRGTIFESEGRSTIVNQRAMLEKLRQQFSDAAQAPAVEEVAVPDCSSAREEELEELLAKAKKENVELSIKIANLQDELSRENSEGSHLLERHSQMQAELSDVKFQLETESQSSRRLGAENTGLQEQLSLTENELKSLRRRVATAEESSVRFEEEAKVLQVKLARIKDEQEAFDQHARQLQKQASDALAREQGARAELDSMQQLVEHHRIAAETSERMRIEGESSARWMESENERLKAELDGEKNERLKIKQVVDELVTADGMSKKEEMQREIDKWRARAAHLERESKEAKALNNEMTKLMSQMTQAVSERSDDTTNIHKQNASLVKQVEAKTQELRTARLEKEEIQSRYDNLQSTGTYFQDKYKEACSELRTLKQEHSISTATASKLKLRVESLQKETEELRGQCARLSLEAKNGPSLDDTSRIERYESTVKDLEQRIRSKDEETRSKEAFIAKSQAVNDCLNTLLVLESEQTALYEESMPLHDENLRQQITAKKDKANHVIGRLNEIMNEDERPSIAFLRR